MPLAKFDSSFWKGQLTKLGYTLSESKVPVQFLRERRAIPPGVNLKDAKLLYQDPLGIDIVILEFDKLPSRIGASKIARYWKAHQGGRQLIIFTDGIESYTTVIPNAIETPDTKLRILSLSERMYRTDEEAFASLNYVKDSKKLREQYDLYFLPYEKVRKEFFEAYRSLYADTVKVIEPVLKEYSNSYAQRFLGRLMFLYFLQRKGWLKEDKNFVDSIEDYSALNWVFYVGLSTEGNPGLPYLDGTLFEREEYLSAEKEGMIKDSMDIIFIRARELFNQYNFTVDELSSREIEVGLDPAMIGTIFENMLPENERGSKGTFYTPPEEISFICRRALASYLKIPEAVEKTGEKEVLKDGISSLIENLNNEKSEKNVRDLRDKILSITVLDPAVGSGGFLLGMMQEMVDLLRQAYESVGWYPDVVEYKEKILQNLFGFDIEDEAIEIARLRIWLSMIVDKKEPEALQSLDLNIVRISDSLIKSEGIQRKLGDELESTWDEMRTIREKFATAKKPDLRARLRRDLQRKQTDIEKKTGVKGGTIESWVPRPVDIIVMNPPYVRQESIPSDAKKYYTSNYKIDRKSDLYCYFVLRALNLVNQNGIISVISSDKWLETGYGEDMQRMLSTRLIGVYGQRERTFGADVNSIIFVYSSETVSSKTTDFVYLESYSSLSVRNHAYFQRKDLKPGKWFYLRAPKMFMEKIYPKLTHKLGDFAGIKFGIKTGANDFFYMKDISSEFETDFLSSKAHPKWTGLTATNEVELKKQGYVYAENEIGERFILEAKNTAPLLRSIRDYDTPHILRETTRICLLLQSEERGKEQFTARYIAWGESKKIFVNRGAKKGSIKGYNNLSTVKARTPWFVLPQLRPAHVAMPELYSMRFLTLYSEKPVIADHLFDVAYTNSNLDEKSLFFYLNSTLYFIMLELWSPRMGGGALHPRTVDYKTIPVPDLSYIKSSLGNIEFGKRVTKIYLEEVKEVDRRALDKELLLSFGFGSEETETVLKSLYAEYLELVNDRLIKAEHGTANRVLESESEKLIEDMQNED